MGRIKMLAGLCCLLVLLPRAVCRAQERHTAKPEERAILHQVGNLCASEDYSAAAALAESALKDQISTPWVRAALLRWLGRAYCQQGNLANAIDALVLASTEVRDARHIGTHQDHLIRVAWRDPGLKRLAVTELETIRTQAPEPDRRAMAAGALGIMHLHDREYPDTKARLREALEGAPEPAAALFVSYLMSYFWYREKDPELLKFALEQAFSRPKAPQMQWAVYWIVQALCDASQWTTAAQATLRMAEVYGPEPREGALSGALLYLADARKSPEQAPAVEQVLRELLETSGAQGKEPEIRYVLACLAEAGPGGAAEAERLLRQVIQEFPRHQIEHYAWRRLLRMAAEARDYGRLERCAAEWVVAYNGEPTLTVSVAGLEADLLEKGGLVSQAVHKRRQAISAAHRIQNEPFRAEQEAVTMLRLAQTLLKVNPYSGEAFGLLLRLQHRAGLLSKPEARHARALLQEFLSRNPCDPR